MCKKFLVSTEEKLASLIPKALSRTVRTEAKEQSENLGFILHLLPKKLLYFESITGASLIAQWVKNPPAMQETQETGVQSLGQEDPLEEEMETHSSILAWEMPWTEGPGRLQSKGSQRIGHN